MNKYKARQSLIVNPYAKQQETIEVASFERFCKKLGVSPQEKMTEYLRNMKEENLKCKNEFKSLGKEVPVRADLEDALARDDYWGAIHALTDEDKIDCVTSIASNAGPGWYNYPYLERLARQQNLPAPKQDTSINSFLNLMQLMLWVPHINLFEMEVNAFFFYNDSDTGIPFLCVYEHLITTIVGFSQIVFPAIFNTQEDGSLELASPEIIQRRAQDIEFMRACRSVLDIIFCKAAEATVERRSFGHTADNWYYITTASTSAQLFVWYHEYGHFLRGHADIGPCHRAEYEADEFATHMLFKEGKVDPNLIQWKCIGIAIVFSILIILNKHRGTSVSDSHPTPSERVERLSTKWRTPIFHDVVERLALAIEPTLKQWRRPTLSPD
jgi:hypothetical protein